MSDVTRILDAIQAGDPQAVGELLPLVYDELRRLAAAHMAHETPGQTLDATALVHEAYLRLVGAGAPQFANQRHFFAAAAAAMRRILVENARRKKRKKHGGGLKRHELTPGIGAVSHSDEELIALDTALARFAERYPLQARLVELRYFAGLSGNEAAQLLEISPSTADRHWLFARAWLRRELRGQEDSEKE